MATRPTLASLDYQSPCLVQACHRCAWSTNRGREELEVCPACGRLIDAPGGLEFGGLSVQMEGERVRLLTPSRQQVTVEPADLHDLIKFLVRSTRGAWEDAPLVLKGDTERGFLALAEVWRQAALEAGNHRPIPPDADLAALACLLLARERTPRLGTEARRVILANHEVRINTRFEICDSLVWELCAICFRKKPAEAFSLTRLCWLMKDGDSGLRIWGMHMAWILKDLFPPGQLRRLLFENIAGTLKGVEHAIGLAVAHLGSEERFLRSAAKFHPKDDRFENQFRAGIEEARARGPRTFQAVFERKELELRRLIEAHCLG